MLFWFKIGMLKLELMKLVLEETWEIKLKPEFRLKIVNPVGLAFNGYGNELTCPMSSFGKWLKLWKQGKKSTMFRTTTKTIS